MAFKAQSPAAVLDWAIDYQSCGYLTDGETLQDSDWSIKPSGPELTGKVFTATVASVKVGGLVWGKTYVLTNIITTSGGRTDSRKITIRAQDT